MIPSTSSHTDDTQESHQSVSENDSDGLLPGCWLETPWDPSTIGSVTEQSRLIDLIPLLQTQWIRTFLFWIVLIAITIGLGIFGPMVLSNLKLPTWNPIELGQSGLDRWLEGIILFLASGTAYLTWHIRRQKPECFTQGYILLTITFVCLYMSIDRTTHIADTIIQYINTFLNPPLDDNGCMFWESIVYGTIYLALLSRLLIEFSGGSLAQTFLLLATGGYFCSCGVWFAPEDWKLPLTTRILSGSLTLISDFFLFWSLVNYARFLLLDGFGLTDYSTKKLLLHNRVTKKYRDNLNAEKSIESRLIDLCDEPHNTNAPKSFGKDDKSALTNETLFSSTKDSESVHKDTAKDISMPSVINSSQVSTEETVSSNEMKLFVTTEKTATAITPTTVPPTSNNSQLTTGTETVATQAVASSCEQVPPATQQPLPYSQTTPTYIPPQYGYQPYSPSYSQQPYSPLPYNPVYNPSYGISPSTGQIGYGQPQPFVQPTYGQLTYPQSYMAQQPVQISQPIPQGGIPQAVNPQPITQPITQQPIQTASQIADQPSVQKTSEPLTQSVQSPINPTTQEQEMLKQLPPSLSPLEIQKEFKMLEERIHRSLTHEEKKAVVCRLIKSHQVEHK